MNLTSRRANFKSLPFRLIIRIIQDYHLVDLFQHLKIDFQWQKNTEEKKDIITRFQKNWYGYFKNDFTRKAFVLFKHFQLNEPYSSLGNLQFVVNHCLPSKNTKTLIVHDIKSYKFYHDDIFCVETMKKYPNLRMVESSLFYPQDYSFLNETNKELECLDLTVSGEINDTLIESINPLSKHPKLKTLYLDFEVIGFTPKAERYSYNVKLSNIQDLSLTLLPKTCDFLYLVNVKYLEIKSTTLHNSQISNIVNLKKLESFTTRWCTFEDEYYKLFEMKNIRRIAIARTFSCSPLKKISRYPDDLQSVEFEYKLEEGDEDSVIMKNLGADLEKKFRGIDFSCTFVNERWY